MRRSTSCSVGHICLLAYPSQWQMRCGSKHFPHLRQLRWCQYWFHAFIRSLSYTAMRPKTLHEMCNWSLTRLRFIKLRGKHLSTFFLMISWQNKLKIKNTFSSCDKTILHSINTQLIFLKVKWNCRCPNCAHAFQCDRAMTCTSCYILLFSTNFLIFATRAGSVFRGSPCSSWII